MVDYALAGIALASLAYGAVSGERQAGAARQNRRDQQKAQDENEAVAVRQARQAEEEENRAKQKSPDLNVLLSEQILPKPGASGIDAARLTLGTQRALGY